MARAVASAFWYKLVEIEAGDRVVWFSHVVSAVAKR